MTADSSTEQRTDRRSNGWFPHIVGGTSISPGDEATALPRHERPDGRRYLLLWGWVLVVVLYFAWEAAAYRGLFAYMAEWEFDHIGQDLPTFNFGLLAMLFAWPALILFRRRRIRDEQDAQSSMAEIDAERMRDRREAEAAVSSAQDYMHFLMGFAAALLLAGIVALLWTLTLPRLSGDVRDIAVEGGRPSEGPARLVGTVGYGRIASFSRGILFVRRSELYAPILTAEGRRDQVRYFVEFSPDERGLVRNGASLTRRRGILVRSDLPGALVRLYRYLGYKPAKPYYVLYASSQTIRWPYYIIAAQFLIGSLAFLVSALVQRRHVRKLGGRFEESYIAPRGTFTAQKSLTTP